MSDIIKIDKNEILQFKKQGSSLVVKKEAEEALVKLLDLKDFIDKAVEDVKEAITASGRDVLGGNFKGVIGERIKAVYRAYGDKYQTKNPEFQKEIVIKRADSDKIDEYVEKKGELPKDTSEKLRELKLIITRINEKQT
jgi:transposase